MSSRVKFISGETVANNEAFILDSTQDFSGGGNWMTWKNLGTTFADIRPTLFSHLGTGNSSFGGKLNVNATGSSSIGLDVRGDINMSTTGTITRGSATMVLIDTHVASPLEHVLNFNDRVSLRIQGIPDSILGDRQFPRIRTLMSPTIFNAAFQIYEENNHTTSGNKALQLLHNSGAKTVLDVDFDGTVRGQDLANGGGTNNPFKFLTREQDNATGVGYIFDSATLSNASSRLASFRNNGTEKVRVKFNGYTWLGGTPSYTPDANAGLVVNSSLIQLGDGTSNVGLDLKCGSSGAYISDASIFWLHFLKSPNKVEFDVKQSFANNVGIIETQQANGSAGAGSPGFKINAVNALSTAGDRLLSLHNGGSERLYVEYDGTIYAGQVNNPFNMKSLEDDGSTAIGYIFDTVNSLTTTTAKLFSFRNGGTEKFGLAKNGGINAGSKGVAVSASSTGETLIGVTDTSAARTITLDQDDEVDGRVVIIKDESGAAATNNITVDTEGSSTIDGAASVAITANYGVLRVYFRNGNWFSF